MSNRGDRQGVGRESSTSATASASTSSRECTKRAREVHGYEDEDDAQIIPSTKRVEVEGHGIKELYENRIRKLEQAMEYGAYFVSKLGF